jgi:hypothetical protein
MKEEIRKKLIEKYTKYFKECHEDQLEDVVGNLIDETHYHLLSSTQ